MAARTANAMWEGTINEGGGRMSLGSGAFEGAYSFESRFGEGENGTTPEELIAAAHAGCFTMALTLVLEQAGSEKQLTFEEGDTVRFRVRSDTDEEVHVHGYDREVEVPAGKTVTVSFKATITGIFEIEFHHSGESIGQLKVEPG